MDGTLLRWLLPCALLMGFGACAADDRSGGVAVPRYQQAPPSNGGSFGSSPVSSPVNGSSGSMATVPGGENSETTQVDQLMPPGNGGSTGASAPLTPPPSGQQNPEMLPGDDDMGMEPTSSGGASPGCGLSSGRPANANVPNALMAFPESYDGSTPHPLLFAFHGANRTNTDMRMVDSRTPGSELEANYVIAFMKSAGNAWDLGTDYPRFEAALDQLLAERCIDTGALFAMGHSSGAQFIAQMLGDGRARETRLAAVAPVSSSLFQNPAWDPIPTLLIHGLRDTSRPNDLGGAQDITQYVASNRCSGGTQPVEVPSCPSLAGGVAVDAGCIAYSGCIAPTLFCNHDDPNYLDNGNPTNHGWPCFANRQIFEFFESVR